MKFTKMHGIGNDYVYVNCFEENIHNATELAKAISNRHLGVGADGLITVGPSEIAEVRMRIYNADGSEAEMCGNGIRCVAKYAYERQLAHTHGNFSIPGQQSFPISINIETGKGLLVVGLLADENDVVEKVCVNMGQPVINPKDIPVDLPGEQIVEEDIDVEGDNFTITCVSMGNPHAVIFCENLEQIDLSHIGPAIENHSLFPNRINVHFVQINDPEDFTMRTWERGSGITLACGTGACACSVAAVLTGRLKRVTKAHLPGGDLELNWCEEDNCVYMTGSATQVFTGDWPEQ